MRKLAGAGTCLFALVVACGGAGPAVKPIAQPPVARETDPCASGLAAANAFEDAGRTRRAVRAIRALPDACLQRSDVAARWAALDGFLAPPPQFGDEAARAESRRLLVDGDVALRAGNLVGAKAVWEKSWTTFHPNGAALVRLGELTRRSDPVASRRFFERATTDFMAMHDVPEVVVDRVPWDAAFRGADPRLLAASAGGETTIFQDGTALATLVGAPRREMTIVDGVVRLDGVARLDLTTGRVLELDPSTNGVRASLKLGESELKDAHVFARDETRIWFAPKPAVTTGTEARAIQALDPTGWHAKLVKITTRRWSPTVVQASLQNGSVVRRTLTFSCVESELSEQLPNVSSYSGVTEKDHCDEPTGVTASEDGSLSVVQRRVSKGSFVQATGALTVTDFGAKRVDVQAPEGQGTNVVDFSTDGSKLLWQFGHTTRLYLTKTMTSLWENTKLADATHASFSAAGDEIALTSVAGVFLVSAADGAVRSTLPSRVPIHPSAIAAASVGFAFAVNDAVAFVTPEGVAWASASAPIEALRASPRLERVVAFGAGRPCQLISRSGTVVKLPPTAVADAAFSSDGSKLFLAVGDALEVYDATTGAPISTITKANGMIRTFAVLGEKLVIATGDELATYDPATKAATSLHLGAIILRVAVSADQSAFVVLARNADGVRVRGYDAAGTVRFDVPVDASTKDLVAFQDDFVVVDPRPHVEVLSLTTGKSLATPTSPPRTDAMVVAGTSTQIAFDEGPTVRVTDPLGVQTFALAFLPGRQVMVKTENSVELLGGAATCRAGALFVPIEVCDGILTDGALARLVTTKP